MQSSSVGLSFPKLDHTLTSFVQFLWASCPLNPPSLLLTKARTLLNCMSLAPKLDSTPKPTPSMSDLTDINIATTSLNSTLFPGAPSDISVHKGFSDEHGLTGGQILAEVNKQLTANNAKHVTLVSNQSRYCMDALLD